MGATLSAGLAIMTFIQPAWIEVILRIEPDGGSGSFEVLLTAGAAVATLTFVALAGIEWRHRLQPAAT